MAFAVKQDVLWLQVAVDKAAAVQMGDCQNYLGAVQPCQVLGEDPLSTEQTGVMDRNQPLERDLLSGGNGSGHLHSLPSSLTALIPCFYLGGRSRETGKRNYLTVQLEKEVAAVDEV